MRYSRGRAYVFASYRLILVPIGGVVRADSALKRSCGRIYAILMGSALRLQSGEYVPLHSAAQAKCLHRLEELSIQDWI